MGKMDAEPLRGTNEVPGGRDGVCAHERRSPVMAQPGPGLQMARQPSSGAFCSHWRRVGGGAWVGVPSHDLDGLQTL